MTERLQEIRERHERAKPLKGIDNEMAIWGRFALDDVQILLDQFAASQRREQAAVKDLTAAVFWTEECQEWCNKKNCEHCRSKNKFEWRGPQGAEK